MDNRIQVFFIISIIIYLFIIFQMLKKKKLNLKYTLMWLFAGMTLLVITIFPKIMYWISNTLGIHTPINSAFLLGSMFIIMILITLTSIVSELNSKVRVLIQEMALLEKELDDLKKDSLKH